MDLYHRAALSHNKKFIAHPAIKSTTEHKEKKVLCSIFGMYGIYCLATIIIYIWGHNEVSFGYESRIIGTQIADGNTIVDIKTFNDMWDWMEGPMLNLFELEKEGVNNFYQLLRAVRFR